MQPRESVETLLPLVYLIPVIILVEGFASIGVEILAIRQLLPFVGSSVVVTSLIIGIFLLFLALGYDYGGRVNHALYHVLRRNFLLAAILVGVGMSYLVMDLYFNAIQKWAGDHLLIPLVIYLLLILAPTIFLLGQTLPMIMNIVRQNKSAGVIAGRALGLSTIGSFLGAIMTTLLLMHYLGVAVTILILFAVLCLLAILLSQTRQSLLNVMLVTVVFGLFVYNLNVGIEKKHFVLTTNHANYQVLDHANANLAKGTKILVINNAYSSQISHDQTGFSYIEEIKKILFKDLKINHANILVLGAGGFSLSQGDQNHNYFTYVDIDDQITKAVVPAFLNTVKDKIVYADARQFLRLSSQQYGVIVVDVFASIHAIPSHLLSREFMQSLREHLLNQGFAVFNIIGSPFFDDRYTRRIYNTIQAEFGNCAIIPKSFAYSPVNIIFVCQNKANLAEVGIYTDDKNTSTVDAFTR